MNVATQRNIGGYVTAATSVQSQAASAAVNGGSIDRQAHSMAQSCVLQTTLGAAAGSPTAISVVSKIQHSQDNSTWTDYEPDGANVATSAALTAADTENGLAVDLTAADRYIRVVTTPTLTGGTSPTVQVAALVILGGENTLPAV